MSLLSYREAAHRDVSLAAAAKEDQSHSVGDDSAMPLKAWQGSADFNPLMERALRAQQMAEGRVYRSSYSE